MALNWQTFRTRTSSSLIFVAVMLVGLLWNELSFLLLFSIIHFGCWWEYLKLTEKIYDTKIDKFIKYFLCICGFMIFLAIGFSNYTYSFDFVWVPFGNRISLKWGLIIVLVLSLFAFLFQNKQIPGKAKWFAAAGLIYISLSLGLMLHLYSIINLDFQDSMFVFDVKFIPVVIIASIWANDTMAYIIGSLIGKTPVTKISPKKTWEGTIGGIVLSIVFMAFVYSELFYSFTNKPLSIFLGTIAAIAAITGTFGDLLESKLKRMAGVKDSGTLLPGHGGFLDRFDSLLLATPAVWLYVRFFML